MSLFEEGNGDAELVRSPVLNEDSGWFGDLVVGG